MNSTAEYSKPIVGFIGLGLMGKPMARNLLRAGYSLVVHNRSRAPVEELAAQGAAPAFSPREVAERSDLIITMLTDPDAVALVIGGPNGVLEGARPGALVVDMSTSDPRLARELAARGSALGVMVLDAPVSGGQVGAEQASLVIMVGGPLEAFERARPVLAVMGKSVVHVGEAGAGQVVKAANQIVVGLTIEAVAEALALTARAGVDPARAREALLGGFASSRVLELHGARMVSGDLKPGARVSTQYKDLGIGLALAEQVGLDLPCAREVHARYGELIARGLADLDHAALIRLLQP